MDLEPNDLLLFARVVDEGSFSRAAERLNLPKSTVSRRVAALEVQLGERLLLRTTRKLTVTDFGRAVLEHAHHVVEDVTAAASLAHNRQIEPSGRLRVSMPGDMANLMLAPLLEIAAAGLQSPAPAYIARRGMPSEPEALMEHDTLRILSRAGDAMPWVLKRGDERWEGIPPGRATTNSPELLMRMALQGAGITMVTDHFALPYLQRGELVEVLPDWHLPPVNAWAVFPGRRLMPARTRVFLDALAEKFTGPECQAAEGNLQKTKAQLRPTRSATPALNLRKQTSRAANHPSSRRLPR